MADKITFPISVREYELNGACIVRFSPADSFFAEKLFNVFDELGAKQDEYEKQVKEVIGKREVFELARARDAEMRDMVNGVFGQDVCTTLFPDRCIYSSAEGLPEWCNLLLAIMDVMDATVVSEQKASSPRVQKYSAKYQKYQNYRR